MWCSNKFVFFTHIYRVLVWLAYQIFLLAKNIDKKLCFNPHISDQMVGCLGSSQLHLLLPPSNKCSSSNTDFQYQYGLVSGEFAKQCIGPASVIQHGIFPTAGLIVFVG